MALTAAELRAVYVVDERPLDKSLAGVPAKVGRAQPKPLSIDGDGRGFDQAATGVERRAGRMAQSMKSTVGAIAGYFAFDAIASTIGESITAASDLNQAISTSSVIFGDSAGEIDRWARGAWQSVGLSRRAATEAAIGFGDMFQQLGWTQDAAAGLSRETVQLAADLGAFRNLPTGDVVERITAAFRGEYDSLQLLIPNINAARVEQEALAATGKKSADQLTAQEKAAATLAIVQRDGARAAGAFAREADELSGSQQRLAARAENAKVKLGELLTGPLTTIANFLISTGVPVFEAVVTALGWLITTFTDLPGPIQAVIVGLTALHLLKGPLSGMLETVSAKITGFATGAGMAVKNLGGVRGAASGVMGLFGGPWGVALAAAGAAWGLLSEGQEKFEKSARAAAVELASQVAVYGDAATSSAELGRRLAEEAGLFDGLAASRRGANEALEETGGVADFANDATGGMLDTLIGIADQFTGGELAARGFTDEIKSQAEEMGAYEVQSEAASAAMKRLNDLVAEGTTSGPEYEAAVRAAAEAQAEHEATSEAAAGAVDEYRGATDEATASAEAHAEAVDQLKDALDRFLGIAISTAEAQLDVADGLADITEAAEENGTSLDRATQAGRDNERMILDQITAMGDLTEATFRETGSADKAREAFNSQRDALRNTLLQLGFNRDEVERLINTYARVPDSVYTDVQASTSRADAVISAWLNQRRVMQIQTQIVTGGVRYQGAGQQPTRAEGGPVWPGQTFLVGEEGPELVRFAGHGTVIPAAETARLMAAGNTQAMAGLTARAPMPALPAPTRPAGTGGETAGGRGALFHADRVTVIEGTPVDVARQLELGARTRGDW